ncbi:MAG: hypothetical protein CNCCGFBP_00170 [Fimbriimonadaceae bacterium]|nr:hypothetical protein [Fimbriimonadaceae bacterium]
MARLSFPFDRSARKSRRAICGAVRSSIAHNETESDAVFEVSPFRFAGQSRVGSFTYLAISRTLAGVLGLRNELEVQSMRIDPDAERQTPRQSTE